MHPHKLKLQIKMLR